MTARKPQRANGKRTKPTAVLPEFTPKIEDQADTDRIKALKATPLGFLEMDQVREILMSMCQKDPKLKKAYDWYKQFGSWDTRIY